MGRAHCPSQELLPALGPSGLVLVSEKMDSVVKGLAAPTQEPLPALLGKIRYLWNCISFFTKFTAFTAENSGHISCKFY